MTFEVVPEPESTEPARTRKIIHLQLHTDWDAKGYHAYFKAPPDFDDQTDEQRQAFLREEEENFLHEHVEAASAVYADDAEAIRATRRQWGSQYGPDMLEDPWT